VPVVPVTLAATNLGLGRWNPSERRPCVMVVGQTLTLRVNGGRLAVRRSLPARRPRLGAGCPYSDHMPGTVEAVTVEGYLSIRSARVELRQLNVLIGANGAGKSNFVSAFELLGRILDQDLASYVVTERGGASQLMHEWSRRGRLLLRLDGASGGYEVVVVSAANDEIAISSELAWRSGVEPGWAPVVLKEAHRESGMLEELDEPAAITGHVLGAVTGCRVHHFHDTSRTALVRVVRRCRGQRRAFAGWGQPRAVPAPASGHRASELPAH